MLRHQLGESTFRRGIKTYLERYRTKEVITADLERTLEEVSGRSLARFFQQWVYSGGYPELEVAYSWDGENKLAKVKVKQTQKVNELTPCFFTPLDLTFTLPTADDATLDEHTTAIRTQAIRITLGEDGQVEQSFYFPLEREPLMLRVDPDGWLLKTLKFERSTKMLRYQLANDPDVLGRIEAAEALDGSKNEDAIIEFLSKALNNDAFWGVRAAVALTLGKVGSEQAQSILIKALQELDPYSFSRVRAAIAHSLGKFQVPQQTELAQRSAQILHTILEKGDVSYRVEAACAEALGQTRTTDNVDFLIKLLERPSWTNYVQRAIFDGLASTGEDRVVDIIAGYLYNTQNHPTLRRAAALGLGTVGNNRHRYSNEARQRAVTALCTAVEHDSWAPVRRIAGNGLIRLGDTRAISVLERTTGPELDDDVQRAMRVAIHTLSTSDKNDEQLKLLRKDLDEVREENRKLREQLGALEARIK